MVLMDGRSYAGSSATSVFVGDPKELVPPVMVTAADLSFSRDRGVVVTPPEIPIALVAGWIRRQIGWSRWDKR